MKTLKILTLGLCFLAAGIVAKADTKPLIVLSKDYTLKAYIDIVSHGKLDGANEIFDANAKFTTVRGKQVISYTKSEMLSFMKQNKNIEQNCTVTTTQVENNENMSVIRVDMQYKDFIRSNYVTIANTGDGWKITNVDTVFK